MPRKAKPLRMWMIKSLDGNLLPTLYPTKNEARQDAGYYEKVFGIGYRAVRVTVTEDTNGR